MSRLFIRDFVDYSLAHGVEIHFLRFENETAIATVEVVKTAFNQATQQHEQHTLGFVVRAGNKEDLYARLDVIIPFLEDLGGVELSEDFKITALTLDELPDYYFDDNYYYGLLRYKFLVTNLKKI